jgi:GT2 family glycosyltransferase
VTRTTVGFLWDSLSENLGDQAIGLALLRLAARRKVDRLRAVRIGEEQVPGRHRLLIIGGGELLRAPGHPYYDLFRVPGEHLLNAAGTGGSVEAGHLASYRLVSVRSAWDRENLLGCARQVDVVPCHTVLFPEVAAPARGWVLPRGAVGVHLNPASLAANRRRAIHALRDLDPARLRLVSFTPYNQDLRVEQAVAAELRAEPPLAPTGPDEAFQLIRSCEALVATSLHATLFAYAAGVPFLSLDYSPKVRAFLGERRLTHRLLASLEELPARLHLLAPGSADWQEQLAADRTASWGHLDRLLAEADRALTAPVGALAGRRQPWRGPSHPAAAHRLMMEGFREYGLRIAERIAYEAEQERAERSRQQRAGEAARLGAELAGREQERARVEGYARELEAEVGRRKAEAAAREEERRRVEAYARDLEAEVERQRAEAAAREEERRRVEAYARDLEAEVERQKAEAAAQGKERLPVEAYARDLEAEVERWRAEAAARERERARAEGYGRQLEAELATWQGLGPRPAAAGRLVPGRPARRVHAVVVHHRGRELLQRCLASLLASRSVELEVVVVANACREPLPEVATGSPQVRVVASEAPLNFSQANNLGVAWSQGHLPTPDLYLFLNNDTVVEEGALGRLVTVFEGDADCGIAGPRLMIWGSGDRLNSLGLQVTRDGQAWDEGIGQRLVDYGPLPGRRAVLAVTGSALAIRADLLARLDGWEDLFEYYYEDIDLCLRVWKVGFRVVHVPDAVIWHAVSATAEGRADFKLTLTWRNRFVLLLIHWPAALLLRGAPRILAGEMLLLARRLRIGATADARRQLHAWRGALARLPAALARRSRSGRGRDWQRFLCPPGSVPPIQLPEPAARGALAPEQEAPLAEKVAGG